MRSIVLAALAVSLCFAQGKRAFDVATVKPNTDSGNQFMFRNLPGGNLTATGVTLKMLIMNAYEIQAFQLSGGPAWIGTQRWDIQAKSDGITGRLPREQFDQMLRALLENRFQLKLRRESREMPIYALVVAKNGPRLTPSTDASSQPDQAYRSGLFQFRKVPISTLAARLSMQLGRTVVDKTGITGNFDLKLEWTSDPTENAGPEALGLPPVAVPPSPPSDKNGPSIFTAIQDQLGLRLESGKGPVEVVVIESVEKPSEN